MSRTVTVHAALLMQQYTHVSVLSGVTSLSCECVWVGPFHSNMVFSLWAPNWLRLTSVRVILSTGVVVVPRDHVTKAGNTSHGHKAGTSDEHLMKGISTAFWSPSDVCFARTTRSPRWKQCSLFCCLFVDNIMPELMTLSSKKLGWVFRRAWWNLMLAVLHGSLLYYTISLRASRWIVVHCYTAPYQRHTKSLQLVIFMQRRKILKHLGTAIQCFLIPRTGRHGDPDVSTDVYQH